MTAGKGWYWGRVVTGNQERQLLVHGTQNFCVHKQASAERKQSIRQGRPVLAFSCSSILLVSHLVFRCLSQALSLYMVPLCRVTRMLPLLAHRVDAPAHFPKPPPPPTTAGSSVHIYPRRKMSVLSLTINRGRGGCLLAPSPAHAQKRPSTDRRPSQKASPAS